MKRGGLSYLALVLFVVLFCTRPALAYLDPGQGSLLLQLFLGGIAALAVMFRMAIQRFFGRFRRRTATKPEDVENREAASRSGR